MAGGGRLRLGPGHPVGQHHPLGVGPLGPGPVGPAQGLELRLQGGGRGRRGHGPGAGLLGQRVQPGVDLGLQALQQLGVRRRLRGAGERLGIVGGRRRLAVGQGDEAPGRRTGEAVGGGDGGGHVLQAEEAGQRHGRQPRVVGEDALGRPLGDQRRPLSREPAHEAQVLQALVEHLPGQEPGEQDRRMGGDVDPAESAALRDAGVGGVPAVGPVDEPGAGGHEEVDLGRVAQHLDGLTAAGPGRAVGGGEDAHVDTAAGQLRPHDVGVDGRPQVLGVEGPPQAQPGLVLRRRRPAPACGGRPR